MSRSITVTGSPKEPNAGSTTPRKGQASSGYSLVRSAQRFVPKQIVTVSVGEGGFPLAFGQVRDISETGACMVTDFLLGRGRTLHLELNVEDGSKIETDAQIVWSGEGKDWEGAVIGAVLQGVEFTNLPEALRQRLRDLLVSGAFELAAGPGKVTEVRASSFQDVLEELQPELNELGVKVSTS